MKNKTIISLMILSQLTLSCSLDKDYLNGPNASSFPASKTEVESGVLATYKGLNLIDASHTPFPGIQDNISDIGVSRKNSINYNSQQKSATETTSSLVKKVYENIYKTAGRANLVLDGMKSIKDKLTEKEYNSYKIEAILVRDYLYEWGVQLYGDIPYIDKTMSLYDTYTRTPKEEVISQIIDNDLKDELIECLPVRFNKEKYGSARLGRIGAYALKARFCLNWERYEEAATYANKALSLIDEAGYSLEPYDTSYCGETYVEGEPNVTNLFGVSGHKNSNEWIWALQFNTMISGNQHNSAYYSAPRIAGGTSYFGPTQMFIDAIQCSDGKSIAESPLYDSQNPWKNRDPRLDLFCVRPNTRVLGFQFDTNPSVQEIMNYNDNSNGVLVINSEAYGTKSEYGANGSKGCGGYLWRKYLDIEEYQYNNGFSTSSVCTLNYPLIRLAELYLIRAEANIEWNGGNLAQAKSDIEVIRNRAHMPNLTVTGRDDLRSALRYERMVELCDEGFRWFDIRRWGIAEKVISGNLYAPSYDGEVSNAKPTIDADWHVTYSGETYDGTSSNNLRTYMTMTFNPLKDNLWPIPEDEITANPLITQNPGYAGYSESEE